MTDQLAADGLDDQTDAPDAAGTGATATDGATSPHSGDGDTDASDASPSPKAETNWLGRPRRQRISKWDRPPDPHDWRYFVGTLGKVLIATGLLLFGFVAYQLWGTGIETARAQNQLTNEFEQLVSEFSGPVAPDRGMLVAEVPADRPEVPPPVVGDDEQLIVDTDEPADLPEISADDITVPVAVDLSAEAIVQENLPQPFRGDPLLRLEIPKLGRDDIVVPGVTLNDLKKGPGHYPDTPLPGQLGNASIAGHRTTYGAPFFDVDQLSAGDEIITTLLNGDRFVYEVTFVEIVTAADYQVVTTTNPDIAELTLTSCHPKYTARDRIIVHSVLNPDKSSNVGFPTFYSLEPELDAAPIPGDDPTLAADTIPITVDPDAIDPDAIDPDAIDPDAIDPDAIDIVETESARARLDPADEPGSDDVTTAAEPDPASQADQGAESIAEPAAEPTGAALADREPVDAFSQGWFDDRDAFPQIALWGIVLTIISVLAYRISRRYRHDSIGFLVGIVPFLVALYFFFQNINRLLPPGI